MKFDAQQFETLNGLDLATYVVRLMEDDKIAEADFLPYFYMNAETMDMAHLELAVGMLGKIGTQNTNRMVAKYLQHHNFNVRFVATKTIAHIKAVDATVMQCVVEALMMHQSDPADLAQELQPVLNRPADEQARTIAAAHAAATLASNDVVESATTQSRRGR
jgi:hypothetical protein